MKYVRMVSLVLVVFTILGRNADGQLISDVKNLKNYLFQTKAYDSSVRPVSNQSVATTVSVDYFMARLGGLDSVTQQLTTSGYLRIQWTDAELQWDPANYGGIQEIRVSQDLVWKPKLTLKNGFTKLSELGSTFVQVHVNYTGAIEWEPFEVFQSKCPVDIRFFPFDTQLCAVELISWGTEKTDVVLVKGPMGLSTYDFDQSTEWDIIQMSTAFEDEMNQIALLFQLKIKRKPMFFVLNILLPIILLAFLSNCTFVLPADGGEKISYSITVYLAFAVFLTIVSSSLPANSQDISIISVYLIFHLFQGTIIILLTAVQIRIVSWEKEKHVPIFLQKFVLLCRIIRCRSKSNAIDDSKPLEVSQIEVKSVSKKSEAGEITENANENIMQKGSVEEVNWREVGYAFDFVLFMIFLVTLIISTIVLLTIDADK